MKLCSLIIMQKLLSAGASLSALQLANNGGREDESSAVHLTGDQGGFEGSEVESSGCR